MTKMHFTRAAEIVNNIRQGYWTGDLPGWSGQSFIKRIEVSTEADGNLDSAHIRAIWTAEAFILLFREYNPRFNQVKFLKACGL